MLLGPEPKEHFNLAPKHTHFGIDQFLVLMKLEYRASCEFALFHILSLLKLQF